MRNIWFENKYNWHEFQIRAKARFSLSRTRGSSHTFYPHARMTGNLHDMVGKFEVLKHSTTILISIYFELCEILKLNFDPSRQKKFTHVFQVP